MLLIWSQSWALLELNGWDIHSWARQTKLRLKSPLPPFLPAPYLIFQPHWTAGDSPRSLANLGCHSVTHGMVFVKNMSYLTSWETPSVPYYMAPRLPPPWSLHVTRHNWWLLPLGCHSTTPTSVLICLYCSETICTNDSLPLQKAIGIVMLQIPLVATSHVLDQPSYSSSTCTFSSLYFFSGSSLLPPSRSPVVPT